MTPVRLGSKTVRMRAHPSIYDVEIPQRDLVLELEQLDLENIPLSPTTPNSRSSSKFSTASSWSIKSTRSDPSQQSSKVSEIGQSMTKMLYYLKPKSASTRQGKLEQFYNHERNLGKGAFGVVTEVVRIGTEDHYAAKSVGITDDREVKICKRLKHPHVVCLHEALLSDEARYLILDLCTGGDLKYWMVMRHDFLKGMRYQAPDYAQLAQMARQMLSAVAYLHYHRIAHRDVKPDNFLLAAKLAKDSPEAPHLKLADFNLSVKVKRKAPMTDRWGTPSFMAPEVFEQSYTQLCDVWSVGVTVYNLVLGTHPLAKFDEPQMENHIRNIPFTFDEPGWFNYGRVEKAFVQHLLVREKDGRPNARKALEHIWITRNADPDKPTRCSFFKRFVFRA